MLLKEQKYQNYKQLRIENENLVKNNSEMEKELKNKSSNNYNLENNNIDFAMFSPRKKRKK